MTERPQPTTQGQSTSDGPLRALKIALITIGILWAAYKLQQRARLLSLTTPTLAGASPDGWVAAATSDDSATSQIRATLARRLAALLDLLKE